MALGGYFAYMLIPYIGFWGALIVSPLLTAGLLGADCAAVLIGERPGLTAPNSMGAYLTWQPGPHTTDAERNCISNIRPDGIGYADAATKLLRMLTAIRKRRLSGVQLKDDSDRLLDEGQ